MSEINNFPTVDYRFNKSTDIKCTMRFGKGTGIWHIENNIYLHSANILKCKPFEVILKKAKIENNKADFIIDRNNKYKVEIGAKVLVRRSANEEKVTTIKELDTEFQMLKVEEYKELPFAFKKVKFLETVKIK